jgi:mannosylglucosylglycerate synthase
MSNQERKPSVAILHYTSPSVVGGVEAVMAAHAGLFLEYGCRVKYVVGRGEKPAGEADFEVIPLLDSKHPDIVAAGQQLEDGQPAPDFERLKQSLIVQLKAAIQGVNACIVHNAFTLHKNLPLAAAFHELISCGVSTKFIAWCHDVAWANPLYIPKMRDEYPFSLLKTTLPQVTYVTVSELRRTEMAATMGLGLDDIRVISNGISPQRFLKLSPTGWQIAQDLDLLDQDFVLLLPARITKRKNIELAILITRSLVNTGCRTKLIVTGPPGPHNVKSYEYVDFLRDLRLELGLQDEVIFLHERGGGFEASNEVIEDLYGLSDALLFPSSQEGFGIPLIEAGLDRLPVFCSNIPPFREIADGIAEFFELDEDPPAIAARIRQVVQGSKVYQLRQRVLKNYTWPAIFERRILPLL